MMSERPMAVVTGASSGIGRSLADVFVDEGFDVVICAESERLDEAAAALEGRGARVTPVHADLANPGGVEALADAVQRTGRPVDALAINAGVGGGGAFLDRPVEDHLRLIALNNASAVHLAHLLLPAMVARGQGRVLFTSSIAATMPGPYQSTYNASKAFLQSFSQALRTELAVTGVTVTALMPGPTDTDFFERADLEDTSVGQSSKDDPAAVARDGFDALMAGKDHVVAGSVKNRVQTAMASVIPERAASAMHAKMAEPGSGDGS